MKKRIITQEIYKRNYHLILQLIKPQGHTQLWFVNIFD